MQLSRRTVLKSIAAVVMAPTVTLRKTVDREAILGAFVDDIESCLYGTRLMSPMVHNEHVWATNGRELIRTFDNGFERDGGEDRLPDLTGTWDALWRPDGFADFRLPRISELTHHPCNEYAVCPVCDNRRVSYGPTYPEWHCPVANEYDWDVDDNTIRDSSCPACHGKEYQGPSVFLIQGVPFQYYRIKKLAMVPNCRVSVTGSIKNPANKHASPVLCFQGDGFSGLAMPLIDAERC